VRLSHLAQPIGCLASALPLLGVLVTPLGIVAAARPSAEGQATQQ
jgi:hypothetical protein